MLMDCWRCLQANIRGGGEYGPKWHQAALQENRNKAYEDFIAVGEDLVKRGVCTTKTLGCQGGSNGGLLVGNMLVRSLSPTICQCRRICGRRRCGRRRCLCSLC